MSVRVKDARIADASRGTHILVGRGEVSYHRRANESTAKPGSTTTANRANLAELSSEEVLDQINSRIRRPSRAYIVGLASTAVACLVASLTPNVLSRICSAPEDVCRLLRFMLLFAAADIWVIGLWLTWTRSRQEKFARTTLLRYKLDDEMKAGFIALQKSLADLAKSARTWQIVSEVPNWDWKRQAGATHTVDRKQIAAGPMSPPFVKTNIKVYGLSLGARSLFFLPDLLFVFQKEKYISINYNRVLVNMSPTCFIEHQGVPRDSEIIDYTWQYVRKDGGPDLRFSNNRRIPVAQYGYIRLSSQPILDLDLYISNLAYARQFAQALDAYADQHRQPRTEPSSEKSSSRRRGHTEPETRSKLKDDSPYDVLNIKPGATEEEIIAAYRRMVHMYHPDKVARLAPEFRELAEERMKAINAAYEQLKRNL